MIDEKVLIEKLEEASYEPMAITWSIVDLDKAIAIVNQLAEESKECYKDCGQCEGYDKEKHYCPKWCSVVRDTMEELKESNNDFCEWKWGIDYAQVQCMGDRILFGSRRLFTFCPYCGKKIKIAPYQPKEDKQK